MSQVIYTFEPIFHTEDYVENNLERIVNHYSERLIALRHAMDNFIISKAHFAFECRRIRIETRRHDGLYLKVFGDMINQTKLNKV
jgi:hypothetical protein